MTDYIYKICVSYKVFCKLQECDIIPSLEENHVGLEIHISKEDYKKLSDEEKKNLKQYEVVNSPLPKQRKIGPLFDEIKAENLNSAAEKIKCKNKNVKFQNYDWKNYRFDMDYWRTGASKGISTLVKSAGSSIKDKIQNYLRSYRAFDNDETRLEHVDKIAYYTYYGVYSGKYIVLQNVPVALASAMSTAAIPSISSSWAVGNKKETKESFAAAIEK